MVSTFSSVYVAPEATYGVDEQESDKDEGDFESVLRFGDEL